MLRSFCLASSTLTHDQRSGLCCEAGFSFARYYSRTLKTTKLDFEQRGRWWRFFNIHSPNQFEHNQLCIIFLKKKIHSCTFLKPYIHILDKNRGISLSCWQFLFKKPQSLNQMNLATAERTLIRKIFYTNTHFWIKTYLVEKAISK